jgi:hypothetical protein
MKTFKVWLMLYKISDALTNRLRDRWKRALWASTSTPSQTGQSAF